MVLNLDLVWIILLGMAMMVRFTRLLVVDDAGYYLFNRHLYWLGERLAGERGWEFVDRLVSCPFCVGWWVAVGVTGTAIPWGHTVAWQAVGVAAGLSWVGGHLVARLDMPDKPEETNEDLEED